MNSGLIKPSPSNNACLDEVFAWPLTADSRNRISAICKTVADAALCAQCNGLLADVVPTGFLGLNTKKPLQAGRSVSLLTDDPPTGAMTRDQPALFLRKDLCVHLLD